MRALLPLVGLALLLAACGGADDDAGSSNGSPAATLEPGEERTLGLDGEVYVFSRSLPSSTFDASELASAGTAITGGVSVAVARSETPGAAAPWELLSHEGADWDVWQPAAVRRVLDDAGPDATIVSVEAVEWPNACLGVSRPDEACAEVITPGYRVTVERAGERVEYHTDLAGHFRIPGGQ
jgi:hypothetical protein